MYPPAQPNEQGLINLLPRSYLVKTDFFTSQSALESREVVGGGCVCLWGVLVIGVLGAILQAVEPIGMSIILTGCISRAKRESLRNLYWYSQSFWHKKRGKSPTERTHRGEALDLFAMNELRVIKVTKHWAGNGIVLVRWWAGGTLELICIVLVWISKVCSRACSYS